MNFHIFTMVWGSHYLELFRRACFRSLNWPKNQKAIIGCDWHVYTKKEHFADLEQLFSGSPYRLHLWSVDDHQPIPGCGNIPTSQCDSGVILLTGLRNQIAQCLQSGKKMLLAPPDTIFGDGTVPNMLAIGSVPKSCVAVAHPRVLPSILDEIDVLGATRGSLENSKLVTLSMEHMHDSWRMCEIGHPKNKSLIGGISWRRLSGTGMYAVQHRLPTHYLADFDENDWSFWYGQVSFGSWDHRWPAENLIRQQRQRYVGSSDACYIIEVTDWDKNIPPDVDRGRVAGVKEDTYASNHYHNGVNRQTSVIFRGN